MANDFDIPIFVHGIGVNDNLSFFEKKIIQIALKGVDYINCRDANSKNNLEKICNKAISVSPDVVFSLPFDIDKDDTKYCVVMPYNYKVLRQHFRTFSSKEEYYYQLMQRIADNKRVILTATTSSDLEECYLFGDYLKNRGFSCSVVACSTTDELISCLENATQIYAGRMHALIIGLLLNKELFPIKVSEKIENFENDYIDRKIDVDVIKKYSLEGLETLFNCIIKMGCEGEK